MTISAFCQTSYPKRILWEGDTLLAITKPQLVTINRTINDYRFLRVLNEKLEEDIILSDSLCTYWKSVAETNEYIIKKENEKFAQMQNINSELEQSMQLQKKRSRNAIIGVGAGGIVLGLIVGILLKD